MKLALKLPILFVPLVVVPLVIVGLIAEFQLRKYSAQKAEEMLSSMSSQIEAQLISTIESAKANVELISQDSRVKNYLLTENEDERYSLYQRPLENNFASIQNVFPEYFELRILLPDGYEDLRVAKPALDNQTEEEGDSRFFKLIRQAENDLFANLQTHGDTGELVLYASKRISIINPATESFKYDPKLRGYLVVAVRLDKWIAQIENHFWRDGGGLILADNKNRFLLVGQRLRSFEDALIGHLSNKEFLNVAADRLQKMDLPGATFHHHYRSFEPGLTLHAIVPEDELTAAGRRLATIIIAVLFLVMILAIPILLYALNEQIVRPIKRLNKALRDIGEGEERITLPVSRNDEFGELNRAFNQMSSELHESSENVRKLAYNDPLTGLPNRVTLVKMLEREMKLARRKNTMLAVLFIDLDNFKHINDTLGHEYGDRLLREVAQRLSAQLRDYDWVGAVDNALEELSLARLGGDEFMILLSQCSSIHDAGTVAQRIIEMLKVPFDLDGQLYFTGASVGISVFPGDGSNVEEMIKHADLAMYDAKKQGKNIYQYFSTEISERSNRRAVLDQRLHRALDNNAFSLVYQPIVSSETGDVYFYEALIRWSDSELGDVPPNTFIPLAEENGTISAIGDWVIEMAIHQLQEWHSAGQTSAKVSVNVSVVQLCKPDFVARVERALSASNVAPESLIIELTETALIKEEDSVIETIEGLRKSGLSIALDDFGTGYSSLSYLTNLPIDLLKIDRSFVAGLDSEKRRAVLSTIISMAHSLELQVVAEGVDHMDKAMFLRQEHCDYLQGYLIQRPRNAPDLEVPAEQVSFEV